jgi:hypothetical protein
MTLKTRRIIYIFLIIFFLIFTPLILAYSLGYSYDFQNNKIVQTGGFYLKSSPSGAKIFINDKQKNKTPRLISRLLPKEYKVKILKNGFYTWEKQLKIDSRSVTEARNILLVAENHEIKIILENLGADFSLNKYFMKTEEFEKAEQAAQTAKNILKSNIFVLSGEQIFYLDPNSNLLYSSNINGANRQQISLDSLPTGDYTISQSGKFIAALEKDGELFLLNPEIRIFDSVGNNIKNFSFSPDGKKLLYHTENEIWVKYVEEILLQPRHEAGEKELITRFSEKISSAIWYPEDNEHIIFTIADTIKIIELDGRGKRNIYDLFKAPAVFAADFRQSPKLYYNTEKELLYFINNNQLYSAQIKTAQTIIEPKNWYIFGK